MKNKLIRAINRSESAYNLYIKDKKYFQALRIFNANQIVYTLLNEYIFDCGENQIEIVQHYLFHLEDWFIQFKDEEKNVNSLNQKFAFTSLLGSIGFPKDFKDNI